MRMVNAHPMDDVVYTPIPDPFGTTPEPNLQPPVDLTNLRDKFADTQRRIEKLEQQVARLSSLCGALAEHNGLNGEQLTAAVAAVEKKRKEVYHCERCGKVLQRGIAKCIYCGTVHPHAAGMLP
jgi:hypothetical protein